MEPLKDIIGDLLRVFESNIAWFFAAIVAAIFRKEIGGLIGRLTSLIFKWGDRQFEVGASPPTSPIPDAENIEEQQPSKEGVEPERITGGEGFDRYIELIESSELQEAEQIYNAHVEKLSASGQVELHDPVWLYLAYSRSRFKFLLEKLEDSVRRSNNQDEVIQAAHFLQVHYRGVNAADEQINLWGRVRERALSDDFVFEAKTHLAGVLTELGHSERAERLIGSLLEEASNERQRGLAISELADLREAKGDKQIAALYREQASGMLEWNADQVFRLAHFESSNNLDGLSIANYEALVRRNENRYGAANNLGLIASKKNLPAVAIELQNLSAKDGNSLAFANLGYAYLDAGFIEDAERMVNKGMQLDEVHENVYRLHSDIEQRHRHQRGAWESEVESARALQIFVRQHMNKRFDEFDDLEGLAGSWALERGIEAKVSVVDAGITIEWGFENALRKTRTEAKVRARITGAAIEGEFVSSSSLGSLLDYGQAVKEIVVGFIDQGGSTMVLRSVGDEKKLHLVFKRMGSGG